MENTWDKITSRQTGMKQLNDRMDATAKLLLWDDDPYKLVKPDGKTKLRDAISVTPNLPKVFAHGVVADLMGGKWQTVVEGVSGRKSHVIESFVDDNIAQADEYLLERYGIPSLDAWLCNHVCARFAIGVRWIAQIIDGEYKVDCLPLDMRWTPYVLNKWMANITFRTKPDLEQELEGYEKLAKDTGGTYNKIKLEKEEDIEVRDHWDDKINEIWVEKQLVFSQGHKFGKYPAVIVIPASGFMLRDKGYLKHEGEDILFLNSGLYTELARAISLEQTSGYAGLYPGYEKEVENIDGKASQPPPGLGESLNVKKGERHEPVPRGDINKAGQTARVDIQEMVANGAPMSPREYNTPPSAILLAGETELISKFQNAHKQALGIFKSQLARLMTEQFQNAGQEVFIGRRGKRSKYSPTKLGDPDEYTISYQLTVKSKRQELANLTEFAAVYDKLPLSWTLPNILMADDPNGIINDLELERAKQADPAIGLSEMGMKYAEEAEDMEDGEDKELKIFQSKLLIDQSVRIVNQRLNPPPVLPEVKPPSQPKGNTNLLNTAAGALQGEPKGVVNG